jgi:chromosome segregation protein
MAQSEIMAQTREDLVDRIDEIEGEIAAAQNDLKVRRMSQRHNNSSIARVRSRLEQVQRGIERLTSELEGQGMIGRAVDALSGGEGRRALRDALGRERERLDAAQDTLERELDRQERLEADVQALESDIAELKGERARVKRELRELPGAQGSGRRKVFANLERRMSIKREIDQIERQVDERERRELDLQRTLNGALSRVEAARTALETHREELRALKLNPKRQVPVLGEELERQKGAVEAEIAESEEEIAEWKTVAEETEAAIDDLAREIDRLVARQRDLEQQLAG